MICLILMCRNESAVIKRCLESVKDLVDCFCIHDTGSTDNTIEIVQEFLKDRKGCITHSIWRNFGYNRTQSFLEAKRYVDSLGWKDAYGLLLDADMIFHNINLKEHLSTSNAYSIIQHNADLQYPNVRLIRMDADYSCVGPTHEYWDVGSSNPIDKNVCWIEDKNDGGSRADKFARDIKLLKDGLLDEPENLRYLFYLGQSFFCSGQFLEAIETYKRRFDGGGWVEEQFYSLYQIGRSYQLLGNFLMFEYYMQRAFAFRPTRIEPVYQLALHFLKQRQIYKAIHYLCLVKEVKISPSDCLFIEMPVYNHLFLALNKDVLEEWRRSSNLEWRQAAETDSTV